MRSTAVVLGALALVEFGAVNRALAVEDVKTVTADSTQRRYERKAALALKDLGMQASRIEMPVEYCRESGKKVVCAKAGQWTFMIDGALETAASVEIFDWLITQRLDKIMIAGGEAELRTAGTQTRVEVPSIAGFQFGEGPYQAFRKASDMWVGQRVSGVVKKLLSAGLQARYHELPDQERATFIRSKAKELGLPAEFIGKLMNSAFAFFAYVDRVKGSVSIHEGKTKVVRNGKTIEVPSYSVTVTIGASVKVPIYNFDDKKESFVFYNEITGDSGFDVSSSKSFPTKPSRDQAVGLFKDSFLVAIRAVGISLNTELKHDDNFAIFFTADAVEGAEVNADVGVKEDIRIDAPALVTREVDGVRVNVGFVKARTVSINCSERGGSTFELVRGESEVGDLVREHPWTGLLVAGDFGITTYELTKWDSLSSKGGGQFKSVHLGVELDLGYSFNSTALSEFWFNLGGGFGFGADGFEALQDEEPVLFGFELGLNKRIYIASSGIYAAPGVQFGFMAMSATGKTPMDEDLAHSVSSLSLTPDVKFGYNVSPDLELTAMLGWGIPLTAWGSAKVGDADSEEVDAEVAGGVRAVVGLSFHLPVVGPMARLYSKPSKVCDKPD